MPAFRYSRRVQFAETDMAGIVHFSTYFRYLEEAEHALWRAAGLRIAAVDEQTAWPRVAAAFDFKAPLRFEEEFEVSVRIAEVGRRTLTYAFRVERGATLIGVGSITIASVAKSPAGAMKSIDLPQDTVERLRACVS